MFTDITYTVPMLIEASAKASKGWPVYVYEGAYYNPVSFSNNSPIKGRNFPFNLIKFRANFAHFLGAFHGVEYPYMFNSFLLGNYKFTENDHKYREELVGVIVQFIKTL